MHASKLFVPSSSTVGEKKRFVVRRRREEGLFLNLTFYCFLRQVNNIHIKIIFEKRWMR